MSSGSLRALIQAGLVRLRGCSCDRAGNERVVPLNLTVLNFGFSHPVHIFRLMFATSLTLVALPGSLLYLLRQAALDKMNF